jgi:pimeloyl-ACP methyl ester carboxylesterase
MDRVGEVVSYYKNKTGLPIWIFGHSMGTSTATYFANQLNDQSKQLAGIIIAGTIRTASLSDAATLPVLGIHHLEDACAGTPVSASKKIIEGRSPKLISKFEMIEGGVSEGNVCESFAYHGFNQTEAELIRRAAQFILSQ